MVQRRLQDPLITNDAVHEPLCWRLALAHVQLCPAKLQKHHQVKALGVSSDATAVLAPSCIILT